MKGLKRCARRAERGRGAPASGKKGSVGVKRGVGFSATVRGKVGVWREPASGSRRDGGWYKGSLAKPWLIHRVIGGALRVKNGGGGHRGGASSRPAASHRLERRRAAVRRVARAAAALVEFHRGIGGGLGGGGGGALFLRGEVGGGVPRHGAGVDANCQQRPQPAASGCRQLARGDAGTAAHTWDRCLGSMYLLPIALRSASS